MRPQKCKHGYEPLVGFCHKPGGQGYDVWHPACGCRLVPYLGKPFKTPQDAINAWNQKCRLAIK